jgi:hypothetical protein
MQLAQRLYRSRVAFVFMSVNVSASGSDVDSECLGLAGNTEYVMPMSGSIVGVSVATNDSLTAGTVNHQVLLNGSGTGLTCLLDTSNVDYRYKTQERDLDRFAAGDRLAAHFDSSASYTPDGTADMVIVVLVEFDE